MGTERREQAGVSVAGIILVLLGVLFLLQTTGVIQWGVWVHFIRLWPILLIVIGLKVWLGGRYPLLSSIAVAATLVGLVVAGIVLEANDTSAGEVSGTLSIETIFGSADRTIRGESFDGGDVVAIFGSVELDLREAVHSGESLSLELNAVFGSVELHVPREWDVRIDGTPILGSVDDERSSQLLTENAPILFVDASAVFGSVTIRN